MTSGPSAAEAQSSETVSFKSELFRKGIHMTSLSIPVAYSMISKDLALLILIPMTAAFLIADVLRTFHEPSFRLYERIFGHMLRAHEKTPDKKTLNGATWVLISATFCVLVFPKLITITAFAILIISDTMAALIGRRYGTKKYRGKTFEGSSAFVLSAIVVILFTPKLTHAPGEYIIAIISAVIGALAEVFSFDIIDDNFAIPVAIGSALWLLYLVVFPELNVYSLDG
jgi:dolichol kinase